MEKSKMSPITRGNIFEVEAISSSAPSFLREEKSTFHARGGNIFIGTIAVDVRGSFEFAVPGIHRWDHGSFECSD